MILKLIEIMVASLLGFFAIIAVGVYHFIKLFWIYILSCVIFASLFYSGIHNTTLELCCIFGIAMTTLMVGSLKIFGHK